MTGTPNHGLGRRLGLSRSDMSRRLPRLRTAIGAARVGDRRSAPSRRGAAVGSPFPPASPPLTVSDGGVGMTVYVSRNAMADQSRYSDPGLASSQGQVRPADPPLLTYVWHRLFEQQAREVGRR